MQEIIKAEQLTKSYGKLLAVNNGVFPSAVARFSGYLVQTEQEKAQR